jgi:hypothetical protein
MTRQPAGGGNLRRYRGSQSQGLRVERPFPFIEEQSAFLDLVSRFVAERGVSYET